MSVLESDMLKMAAAARDAARIMVGIPAERKNAALWAMAESLAADATAVLAANAIDMSNAATQTSAFRDRLLLNEKRLQAIAESIIEITNIPDPVGQVVKAWTRPNGLRIEQVRVPIGVMGVIYESRPNVTADAAALCLKSGNAVILRPGSDSFETAKAMHAAMLKGLRKAQLPEAAISLVPTAAREAVGLMLAGLGGNIDVIIPRGGKSLVARVQQDARVPVFAHLEGIVHVYVDGAADPAMAKSVLLNAKMRRTGICGAAETLLIDKAYNGAAGLVRMLLDEKCAVRGDAAVQAMDGRVTPATEADWNTEYLDAVISARMVDGPEDAIMHINTHGSHHTDCIITNDETAARQFLSRVDSAIVMHNASTQFADGGEFGYGAEIGIATGRLHARGPVGAEQLTTIQNRVYGTGQIRAS